MSRTERKGSELISQTSEYALRAMVHLARRKQGEEGPETAQQVSEATRVPLGYLHKILRKLTRAGLLVAQRGIGGGFMLARAPEEIHVIEVLRASDTDIVRIETCPLGITTHTTLCSLHRFLDDAIAQTEEIFSRHTLADFLSDYGVSGPLCES